MSYLKKIEYEIVLKDSFLVIRGCPKCGKKTHFINTNKFRVNANGNKLDIRLIYQCEECTDSEEGIVITINNPYQLKVAPEKQIAVVLGLSRSQVKNMLGTGELVLKTYGGGCICKLKRRDC